MFDHLTFIFAHLPELLFGFPGERPGGLMLSILLAVGGIGIGYLIALLVGTGGTSDRQWMRMFSRLYVWVFRGLPLILLLILVHQILGGATVGL